jgi:hypothetical protein
MRTLNCFFVMGTIALMSCGSAGNEETVRKDSVDSLAQAQEKKQKQYSDSVANAEENTVQNNTDTNVMVIDSSQLMKNMNVLDSIMAAKRK